MNYLHNQSVVMCVGLLALAMGPAQGCIFSNGFVDGGSSDAPDMAKSLDMSVTPDLGPPGDIGGSEPLDFSVPDPNDLGGGFDLGFESCLDDSVCPETQQCVGGICLDCPLTSDVLAACPPTADGEPQRCGSVPTGITGNCVPDAVQCEPCDMGTTCSVNEDGPIEGVCEPDLTSTCPNGDEVISLCRPECSTLQYMCGLDGFVTDGNCNAPSSMSGICTDASRALTGVVSHIALGTDRALVTRGALQSPVTYVRTGAGRPWVRGAFSVSDVAIQAFLPPGFTVTSITNQGEAVAMSEDDSVVALTVKLDLAEGSAASTLRNAVLVYRDENPDTLGGLELTQVILGEDEHFATSLDILEDRLAIGSPMTANEMGRVSLYGIDVGQGLELPLLGECGGGVNRLGADVALASFDGVDVVFATADSGVYTCAFDTDPVISPASFEPNVDGPMAVSVSFNGLLISGVFSNRGRARLYLVMRDPGTGLITQGGSYVYATSHPNSAPVMAKLHARSDTDSSPQLVFNTSDGFDVAQFGHAPLNNPNFEDYQHVLPITPDSSYNVLAADANVNGDLVFAASGGGGMSRVFFANVPAR